MIGILQDGRKNMSYFDCCFNPFPNKPWFLHVCSTLKTLGKGEIACNFSFSHSVIYPFGELPVIFIRFKILVSKLFHFGRVLKFVVWERVKRLNYICC